MTDTETAANEITRTVGSIWERRNGARADSVNTVIVGDSVRCTIEGGGDGGPADPDSGLSGTDCNAYRHEASAAVARITKRTVSAYIGKRDAKTGVATQSFILERVRTKF